MNGDRVSARYCARASWQIANTCGIQIQQEQQTASIFTKHASGRIEHAKGAYVGA